MEADVASGAAPLVASLPIVMPPTLSVDVLQSILAGCGASLTVEQLQAPTANTIVQIYTALLSISQLQNTIAQFEVEKKETERKAVDMEMQLNDAERLKEEAEKRAEEDRLAKEEAIRKRNSLASQLAETRGTLQGLQSSAETDIQQSASVKGQLEKLQQEKRDVLEVLERERIENARRAEEIDSLTLRSRDSRSEASRLLTELQEAKSAESTAMFNIQNLEQQLLLKSNDASWAYEELKKTTDELAHCRNEAHSNHTSLTSQLLQATQSLEASQSKVVSLQSAYDNAILRLEEGTRDKSELRQKLIEQESAFASEMDTQQRLSALMEQAKESAERRMAEVEEQWEVVLQQHREKEDLLRSDTLEEKQAREIVEREKEELQLALDRLAESVGIETSPSNGFSVAGDETEVSIRQSTPQRGFISLSATTPSLMSPTAALASKVQKSGKSFTQVYAELARTQEELRRERIESDRIGGVLEQVMADLQERGPALVAQREECEQMSRDLEEMSITLARACEERDICEREAKMKRLEAEASVRESKILSQHLYDATRQVRELTREITIRDDPGALERLEDDGSQIEMPNGNQGSISDTQAIISNELVTFRNLTELVTQNGRLLRIVRELGAKMEAEEQDFKNRLQEGESEAVAEARELISRLQDEIRAERMRAEGLRRERDMFRSMCASGTVRGQAMQQSSAGTEVNAAHVSLTQQYSQLQSQFEALRTETSRDMERLKEEAYQARSEASKNALGAAKEKAKRESVEERLLNAQQTYQMARRELEELQKRCNSMQESLTRQEVASHSMTQQVLKATSNEERLRNEVSNLNAEKRLHQQTAERLLEEKKSSATEKANLSELLRNVQSMQSELEKSSGDSRRRLEGQVERLEEQCKDLRSKLAKEEEDHRQTSMRRELETNDLQMRLNRVNEELGKSKEGLAAAQTSVQHLNDRCDELQKQVNTKEEKLAVYERRTSGIQGIATSSSTSEGDLNAEQRLQVELADLKGELRGAQTEAEQARGHVEQFQAIAAANEEALAQLQATYDRYRSTTDIALAERTAELNSSQERLSAMAAELSSAQQEASTIRQETEAQSALWKAEKRTMEDAMTELGGVEDRARIAQEEAQEEVRRQIRLTQEAQSKYEAELLSHAEDVKAITRVKQELELARSQFIEATREKETAQGNLATSRDSWEAQKALYEREHEELKKVIVELRGQNDALHQHLEALQNQTNEIRQAASNGNVTTADVGESSFSQSGNEELLEVIKYLRREKKIVDLQVEVREQECARLRQSVEHLQRSLDESRLQVSKEREQNAGANVSAQQHAELMEKINQLSILRESNTTLRDETERALVKVQSLESQVEALTAELMPLREELRIKTVELEASENQLRISQEDNKRWQGRTQSILQQYNRIDPEDLKKLQEKKEEAEREVEVQKQALEEREKEVAAARLEVQNKQGQFDRLRAQSIERIKGLNEKNSNLNTELEQLRASQQQLQEAQQTSSRDIESSYQSLKVEHETLQGEKGLLEERIATLEAEKNELMSRIEELEKQALTSTTEGATIEEAPAASIQAAIDQAQKGWDEEKRIMEEKRQAIERREQLHLQKAKEFNTLMKAAVKERDELKLQMSEGGGGGEAIVTNNEETLQALRQRITELEGELAIATARVKELEEGGATPEINELQQRHHAEMKEQESRLSSQYDERQKSAIEIAVNKAKAAALAESNVNAARPDAGVEEQVQSRLKVFEDEKQAQLQSALEAKEKEVKAAYEEQLKARYEAGKEESTLRSKLILKSKDNKIEKLTNELNALKGISPSVPTAPSATTSDATSSNQTVSPAVVQIAGAQRPNSARPIPIRPGAAASPITPAGPARGGPGNRGGGPGRGAVRPVANTPASVQKRKLEGATPTAPATNGASEGGGLPKRPRPAGAPITIRGGATGGARGGRGGGQIGS